MPALSVNRKPIDFGKLHVGWNWIWNVCTKTIKNCTCKIGREVVDHSELLISCELAAVSAMVSAFNVKVTTYDLHDRQVSLPPQILLHLWSHCSQQVIRIHDNVYKWVDQSQQRSMSTYIAIDQATAPHKRTKSGEEKKLIRIQFLLLIWRVFNIQPHKAFIYLFISLSSPTTRPQRLCADMLYVKHSSSI